MMLKFARIGADPVKILLAAIAALFLALPVRAQDAQDPAAEPEASADAVQGAPEEADGEGQPENAGEEPAAGEGAAGGGTPADGAAGGPVVVEIEEGTVLDDQTFEGEDDDFIPSEEIPIDQPIPFPTDI